MNGRPFKKKAVLVGVSNYQRFAPPVEPAVSEALEWHKLLHRKYGFYPSRLLRDEEATREAILEAFEWLVKDASADDQLVFVFIGHGRVVATDRPDGKYKWEEALIAYPNGDATLRSAEITGSDLSAIVRKHKPPVGTDFSLVIDACFAGATDVPLAFKIAHSMRLRADIAGVQALAVNGAEFAGAYGEVRAFSAFGASPESEPSYERPIIVAAAGRDEYAHTVTVNAQKRMLFSWRATEFLSNPSASPTFHQLVHDIRPLLEGIKQTPELRGNLSREYETFPGAPAPSEQPELLSAGNLAKDVTPTTMEIRFKGLCGFAAPRVGDTFQRRVLLPYDGRTDPSLRHIPYIEVLADEVDSYTVAPTATEKHDDGGPALYHRWELEGHRIEFIVDETGWAITEGYKKYVPAMKYGICPTLREHPRDECFLEPPPATLVGAFCDLSAGDLTIGPLEAKKVIFINKAREVSPWGPERTPQWVTLRVSVSQPTLKVKVTSPAGDVFSIEVKRSGYVLVGNARHADIIDDRDDNENPRDHYLLYYNLSDDANRPADPPLPDEAAVPVNACSPVDWP